MVAPTLPGGEEEYPNTDNKMAGAYHSTDQNETQKSRNLNYTVLNSVGFGEEPLNTDPLN